MSEWQPIETAPKDGTPFLATGHDYGDKTAGRHYVSAVFDPDHDAFMSQIDGETTFKYLTHWQPLPPPPEPQQ